MLIFLKKHFGGILLSKLVIMIPGIMGSNLGYGSYRVWPRMFPKNIGVYEKYLPIGKEKLDPAGFVELVYGKLFNFLTGFENTDVLAFDYDWRMDNMYTVDKLDEFIQQRHEDYDEITLVAHSMGGIISKLLLNKFSEQEYILKIDNLITLGTPWHGSLDSYKTILYGKSVPDTFPWHSIVLTKEKSKLISKGFPSVYQLFPDQIYNDRVQFEHSLPLLKVYDNDVDYVGIFEQEEIKTFFKEFDFNYSTLIDGFRDLLNSTDENTQHIQHHEIIGFANTTLTSIQKNKKNVVKGYFRNGDGTVPTFSAKSEFAQHRYFIKGANHQDLVKNDDSLYIIKQILHNETVEDLNAIFRDEDRVKSLGFTSKIVRIACPVDVSILKDGKSIFGYSDGLDFDNENIKEIVDTDINVITLGNTTYLILNEEDTVEDEQIVIEAYDEGPTSIAVEEYTNGEISKSITFKTFNINPNMVAQINLKDDLEHLTLEIHDEENQQIHTEDPYEVSEEEIVLPSSQAIFSFDSEYSTNEMRICTGNCTVNVEVNKGTYDIMETYINVNGSVSTFDIQGNNTIINLENGLNKVKVFSVDILGNEESSEEYNLFYLSNIKPTINYEFLPHRYKIEVKDNKQISDLFYLHEIPRPRINFEINIEENAFIDENSLIVLTDNPRIKEIVINYQTFLGDVNEKITMDENNILTLFEGIGNSNNFLDLLENLNADNPEVVKLTKIEGIGTYRKITDRNLNNSKKFYVSKENKILELIKKSDYILSFHNLKEDIKIGDGEVYNFSFKVFDQDNNELRNLNTDAFLKISIDTDDFITNDEDITINFNNERDVYEGSFRIEIIKEILNGYWDKTPIHSAELVISKTGATSNVIRTKEIKIRRD